ncbi:hypothetical protein CHUAL_003027 [Chamberlinius hualienensis]
MATSLVSGQNTVVMNPSTCEPFHSPPLGVGERVVWLGKEEPEPGTVKWIGMLPNVCTDGWSAGIELDNPVGEIDGHWGGQELFKCPAYHGIVIDVKGLIKETDFLGKESNGHGSGLKKRISESERLSNKGASMTKKTSTATTITAASTSNDILNVSNSVASTSRSSDADEVLGGIITTHSTPASCMGSFDRRVYARMFAECEVEKWYEALNYAPPQCGKGPFDTSVHSLESKNEIDKGLSPKFRKKSSTLDGGCQLTVPKKERGGIFRFFRWLSGRSSSRKTPGVSKKQRRDTNVSELRRGGRTKSLESVTSLSRSFHYIPVGVLCSENDVAQHIDLNLSAEDLNDEDVNVSLNRNKVKSGSLSRAMADEREREKRQRSIGSLGGGDGIESRRHSKQSICPSGSNSPGSSSNASRKKRKAPLPPTNSPRSHWVKVLPTTTIVDHQAGISQDYNQTGSTRSIDSVNSSKHGKVIYSHNKNKRQAPPPPKLITSAEINVGRNTEGFEIATNVKSEVQFEVKMANIEEVNIEHDEKMEVELVAAVEPGNSAETLVEKPDKNENLTRALETSSENNDKVKDDEVVAKVYSPIHLEDQNITNHNVNPVENIASASEMDLKPVDTASAKLLPTENIKLELASTESITNKKLENNIKGESEQPLNNLSVDSEDVEAMAAKLSPKLTAQMNIQALQELVESLVMQYCEASSKTDEIKSTDKISAAAIANKSQKTKNSVTGEEVKVEDKRFEEPNYENGKFENNNDDDLATKLMEKWQLLMREELLNFDSEFIGEKEKKPKISKCLSSSSVKDLNGSSDTAIYEPVGNYIRQHYNRRHSIDEFSGNKSPSSRKPPSGRRRMSSSSTTATDDENTGKIGREPSVENLDEDNFGDPFVFWRELDAKEHTNSNGTNKSKSAKSIRRLSVNGQRQSMASAERHGKQHESNDYDQFTPMAYTNYGYASVYRHLNWPPPPNPQVLSMTTVHSANSAQAFVFPYSNHHQYPPYLPPSTSNYFPFAPNYAQTAPDTCYAVDRSFEMKNKLKSCDDHLQRNDYQLPVDQNRRCRQSNKALKKSEETKSVSGKKSQHSDYADDTLPSNNVTLSSPPPPPPRTNGNCSSRLAASCQWLKVSGKSVEEKIQAARNEENFQIPAEKNTLYNRYGNKNKSRGDSPPSPAAIRARRWPLATLENSVVIGGVRVKTPLNLWPLEYELIKPELKRLKARLEGKPLPEDEMALDEKNGKFVLLILCSIG